MRNEHKALAIAAFVLAISASTCAFAATSGDSTTGQYIDDATITTKVKAALIADPPLKSMQISVETKRGTVELSGAVDTKDQESEAVRVTNQVNGVRAVKDMLTVRGSGQ